MTNIRYTAAQAPPKIELVGKLGSLWGVPQVVY